MALRNKCRFFEVEKDGKSSWRGRKYMIEFHPKELCEYYEKLVLERGLWLHLKPCVYLFN